MKMGNAIGEKASRQVTPQEGNVMRTSDSRLTNTATLRNAFFANC